MNKKGKNTENLFKRFLNEGYIKIQLLDKSDIYSLRKEVKTKMDRILKKYNFKIKVKNLKNYHKFVKKNDKVHKILMNPDSRFINLKSSIEKKLKIRLSNLFFKFWGHKQFQFSWIGDLKKKKQLKYHATGFRIARPDVERNSDVAPMHIDKNAGGIINKTNDLLITIWIPLIGFSNKYTLKLSPKSHKVLHQIKFSQGKRITHGVPKEYSKKFKFFRPNMKLGECLVFSSNLLHGSSNNLGKLSRLSLDCRAVNIKKLNIKKLNNK